MTVKLRVVSVEENRYVGRRGPAQKAVVQCIDAESPMTLKTMVELNRPFEELPHWKIGMEVSLAVKNIEIWGGGATLRMQGDVLDLVPAALPMPKTAEAKKA